MTLFSSLEDAPFSIAPLIIRDSAFSKEDLSANWPFFVLGEPLINPLAALLPIISGLRTPNFPPPKLTTLSEELATIKPLFPPPRGKLGITTTLELELAPPTPFLMSFISPETRSGK